uniref:Glomulin, FKBP associated protein b n=1 Tax=Electrophorus electricus TaxID=8005 RepID=A0A4W4EM16_ELEEL
MAAHQLDDIIQRRVILKPEDLELLINIGQTCIAQGDNSQLLDFIKEEKKQDIVRSLGSGLLVSLIEEVMGKERDPAHCQSVITLLERVHAEQMIQHGFIVIALNVSCLLLHSVFLTLGDTKAPSLGLALEALQKLPVPCSHKQEQEDRYGLGRCCTALMTFVQLFVQEVKRQDAKSPVSTTFDARLRCVLLKFGMVSLREPLLEAQFDREDETSQSFVLWSFATEILVILSDIQETLPQLLFYLHLGRKEDMRVVKHDGSYPIESRTCLAYLLFVQLIAMEVFPSVFSPAFVLRYVKKPDESWILKGLHLYVKSLESLVDNSISVELLNMKPVHSVLQKIVKIMTECPIQHLVSLLFIEKLNGEAKHKCFMCVIKTSQHTGVESFILKNIQNHLVHSSKSEHKDRWSEGTLLISLPRQTVSLPQGPEMDLLMDMVMISLNLLRYLLIKEKRNLVRLLHKNTSIKTFNRWTGLCNIAENYIKTLCVYLSMSKSYYGSALKKLHDTKKIMAKGKRISTDQMPPEAQEKVLQCVLITYDLMESLVVRIEEIKEEQL